MITQQQIQNIADVIVQTVQPSAVYLIGSYATGTANKDSDVDFLVVSKDENIPKYGRTFDIQKRLIPYNIISIDLSMFTPEEIAKKKEDPYSFISVSLKKAKSLYESL